MTLAASLLLQVGGVAPSARLAEPRHLRYERVVAVDQGVRGQVCAVLDAEVFANAASARNDLRLFAKSASGETEVPFALKENEAEPADVESAPVVTADAQGQELKLVLAMPARPYSDIVLNLAAKDFVIEARAWGETPSGERKALGRFLLFDLSKEKLGRSTTMTLEESRFARLVVELHPLNGTKMSPAMVMPATVPPSREAQTLLTTVAETSVIVPRDSESVAVLRIPAHVPIERVSFVVDPGFAGEYLRRVRVTGRPEDGSLTETLDGEIFRVDLRRFGGGRLGREEARKDAVDTTLGANLRGAATVEVAVENGGQAPLPIKEIKLEMRQRSICFDANASGATYVLRYGDGALRPPVYTGAPLEGRALVSAQPLWAKLGPQALNPAFMERVDRRAYLERHPEVIWIGMLAGVAALGGLALHGVKRRGRNGA